ncbi:MAG: DMT family transporter [Rhodospirillaceae bacterium]|nr:DMT family transporter [Rhodospirillaceae bacterium]MYB13874.1 DMT family transporter [Rhodospirillaceae bacterium]MYI48705.1 DMT family transporter [Rhodospirillaceae bacterium]
MSGKMPEPDYRIGFALVLVASACFGLGPALGQFAADNGLSPLTTTAWRFVIPVLVLSPFLPRAFAHGRLAFVGLAVGAIAALGMVAYFTALRHLSVATVSVIYFTYPLFTILLDRVLFGERIRRRAVAASLMIVGAAVVVVPAGTLSGGQAEIFLLAFAAPVGFAILIVALSRTLTPIPLLPRASIGLTGALAGLAPGFLLFDAGPLLPAAPQATAILIVFAAATTVIPQLLYTAGSRHAGAGLTAIAGAFELVVALLVGWLWLGDPVLTREVIAGLLILAALASAVVPVPLRARRRDHP